MDELSALWNRLVSKNRDLWLFLALLLSSLVAFLPFARNTSISNFFVYALLPIIFVFANSKKFDSVPGPNGRYFVLALAIVFGSFAFNLAVDAVLGNAAYGLTDYVILVVGVFVLFYSFGNKLVRFGVFLLVFVRAATLALSISAPRIFINVSDVFVGIVVFFSKIVISPTVRSGYSPGEVVIGGGAAGGGSIFIGWACAGLEELVLISVIIYVLIDSFGLSPRRKVFWLIIGIVGSFVINIVRMVILVGVAYSYGISDMLWVHTHLGDFLFLVWIAIFWVLFFKLAKPSPEAGKTLEA